MGRRSEYGSLYVATRVSVLRYSRTVRLRSSLRMPAIDAVQGHESASREQTSRDTLQRFGVLHRTIAS